MVTFHTKHLTSSKIELTAAASVQRYGLSPNNDTNTIREFGYATVYKSAPCRLVMHTCHATCHTREQLSFKISKTIQLHLQTNCRCTNRIRNHVFSPILHARCWDPILGKQKSSCFHTGRRNP